MIILAVISGIAVGGIFVWLLMHAQVKNAYDKGTFKASTEIPALNERVEARETRISELTGSLSEAEKKSDELNTVNTALKENIAVLETKLTEERKMTNEKLKLLQESKEKLSEAFKNLANEIFEDKSKKFKEENKSSIDALLKPLGENITNFRKKVEETHEKGIKERASLKEAISGLRELNEKLGKEAHNLTTALKGDVKKQGNWGELILERILEASGLQKGIEYTVQESITDEEGHRKQPDVIINLPEKKHVIVDAKVSLNAYERYTSTEDKEARKKYLKEHISSLKKHIKELADKHYQDLKTLQTPDFVFMFVPIESASALAIQSETDIFFEANKSKVVIVTPSTLLAGLKMISYLWDQEKQNKNAAEIARQSGELYNKFVNFVTDLEGIGKRLDQANESYTGAMNKLKTGRGNLIITTEKIKKLGARTNKQIPEEMLELNDADENQNRQ